MKSMPSKASLVSDIAGDSSLRDFLLVKLMCPDLSTIVIQQQEMGNSVIDFGGGREVQK